MLFKMVNGKKVTLTSQEEARIKAEWTINGQESAKNKYKTDRIRNYPRIEDQLDSIFNTFKYLDSNGVDLGPEGKTLIANIQAIKDRFPKS